MAVLVPLTLYNKHSCSNVSCRLSCTTSSHAVRISSRIMHWKKAIFTDWTLKTWNGLLLLDSSSLHRLTWIKTETWLTCQVISSNKSSYVAAVAWTAEGGQLQQSLGLLLRTQGYSSCWDCCYEHRVAASAGVAVTNTKVSAIGGLAVTNRKLQQSLGLLFLSVAAEAGYCRS